MAELSILIPARNELFLKETVLNILENSRADIEIIVVLDGAWAAPPLDQHEKVTVVYHPVPVGQRAATNEAARLATGKYVMKVDAHCAFDEGFDKKLLEAIQGHDNWTVVPTMRNLHAFDWKCLKCGSRWYQGPTPTRCMKNEGSDRKFTVVPNEICDGTKFIRRLVFKPRKKGPNATSYRFDRTLKFQYFPEFKRRPEGQGDITPTMSLQGSCFMMTREKYWELNICDEKAGSWGHQGSEVALKTWLSGGEVMCIQTTWYAHMFRTQGGDFSFPYPQKESEIEKARVYVRELFLNEVMWGGAVHDVQWLVDKFAPVPDWHNL